MRPPGLGGGENWVLARSGCMRLGVCKEAVSPCSSPQLREDSHIPMVIGGLMLEG